MSEKVIIGYKIKDTTDVIAIENIISKIRDRVTKEAKHLYKELLSLEVENLYDDIALGKIPRPTDVSIFDTAKNTLDTRIKNASLRQLPIEYNLNMGIHIFVDGAGCNCYLKIDCNNHQLFKGLDKIPELIPYSLDKIESLDKNNMKTMVWTNIMKNYEKSHPMGVSIINGALDEFEDITPEDLKFNPKEVRIQCIAKNTLISRLVNMYGNYAQIPPNKLFEYIDLAIARMDTPAMRDELNNICVDLERIIHNIDTSTIV